MTASLSNDDLDKLALESDARAGERVLAQLYEFLGRFVSYPSEHAQVAHALWCVHAHLMDKWESTPRLAFLSAEPASGKTRALEISELLVPNPVTAVNVSPAYLFRKVGGEESVTLLCDEIDTVFGPKARENEEIRGLLNAGHRKGAVAGRCVIRGKNIETEEIEAYAAVALGGLGWLPDTILSRSVIIRMRRRHAGERIEQFRRRIHAPEGWRIRDTIASWAKSIAVEWPELPDEIQDRDAGVWEPLIAVADAVGGSWAARARRAAVALVAESKDKETSLGIRLLGDLKIIFEDAEELTSKIILTCLTELPESPWGDIRGKPLDERGLSNRLRPYGIKPKTIRTGPHSTLRGYRRADFEDQWRRLLPPSPDRSATSKTDETSGPVADVLDVLDLPKKGGETVSQFRCAYCHKSGAVIQRAYGVALHRDCMVAWKAAHDDLEIPPFLDRRAGLLA
jgi:hypothetical protein